MMIGWWRGGEVAAMFQPTLESERGGSGGRARVGWLMEGSWMLLGCIQVSVNGCGESAKVVSGTWGG